MIEEHWCFMAAKSDVVLLSYATRDSAWLHTQPNYAIFCFHSNMSQSFNFRLYECNCLLAPKFIIFWVVALYVTSHMTVKNMIYGRVLIPQNEIWNVINNAKFVRPWFVSNNVWVLFLFLRFIHRLRKCLSLCTDSRVYLKMSELLHVLDDSIELRTPYNRVSEPTSGHSLLCRVC